MNRDVFDSQELLAPKILSRFLSHTPKLASSLFGPLPFVESLQPSTLNSLLSVHLLFRIGLI